ncbi:alpha/beta hydrolase [Isobaculum melis]|uniref:Phospholipase/carboxylesterase n=1 Tax=Isobaculum melis TaxID=142588 RepID=A0A1H9U7N6_9LACT|nr:alpha/beta hydrolase [Isobaculum melis]SES05486.1 phospholipase/carboxylesterase [Isobaculum melis]
MKHLFKQGDSQKPVFLLLHGTGGDERDLLPIAAFIDPTASILSVRGNVLENGMPRFFKRLSEGIFDEADLTLRTAELHAFLKEAATNYGFSLERIIPIGYSNGANIAASMLYRFPHVFEAAILLHAMVPIRNKEIPVLEGMKIFLSGGEHDPIVPIKETKELQQALIAAGGDVSLYFGTSHQLTQTELNAAKNWYQQSY